MVNSYFLTPAGDKIYTHEVLPDLNRLRELDEEFPRFEEVGGVEILLPKMPAYETMRGHSYPRTQQKWKPTLEPECMATRNIKYKEDGICVDWTEEQTKFIGQEAKRFQRGFWFFNNGCPTWITGAHYFELCYAHIDIGLKEYRDRDRRVSLHLLWCFENPKVYGQIYMKHRRDGATWRALGTLYLRAIMKKNAHNGMQSKTEDDGKTTFNKLVAMWKKLPIWLQPIKDGTSHPKKSFDFIYPATRKTTRNFEIPDTLNSVIDYRSSTPEAYDGQKLWTYYGDEWGKTTEANILETWGYIKPCFELGSKIVGKAMITTTVDEMEKGGDNFKELYEQSNIKGEYVELNNGRTLSGLVRLFLPAYDGLESFIDEYGYSIIDEATPEQAAFLKSQGLDENVIGAKAFHENIRKAYIKAGLFEKLSEHKRLYPFTEDEALQSTAKSCHFDLHKLETQELALKSRNQPTSSGNFVWKNGVRDSEVIWQPSETGRWKITYLPDPKEWNNSQEVDGLKEPRNTLKYVIGCDPFDHDNPTDKARASKGAFYVFKKFHILDGDAYFNNAFIVQYIHRPPTAELFYEDLLMTAHFFGCKVHLETQKIGARNYFVRRGYESFLMKRPDSTKTASSKNQTEIGTPNSVAVLNQIVEVTANYIYNHIDKVRFVELIADWKIFDIKDTKKHDATMGAGYTLTGIDERIRDESVNDRDLPIDAYFPMYDISKDRSKLIN